MKRILKASLVSLAAVSAVLLLADGVCRLAGHPRGDFAAFFPDSPDLYPRNVAFAMSWGSIGYVVETNNHGLRGDDFAAVRDPGTLRILTIGDSVTDGFFVDNRATWQTVLQDTLGRRLDRPVEVINGARGGGSIDRELALLRRYAPQVDPDLVVLTFVTNDIAEIRGRDRDDLLDYSLPQGSLGAGRSILRFALVRTGLGEFLFQSYLSARSNAYRRGLQDRAAPLDDRRYDLAGGGDHAANMELFRDLFAGTDGLILGAEFDEETEDAFRDYEALLAAFAADCRDQGADLLLVYFPAYTQIHDPAAPRTANNRLAAACAALGVGFLDATDGLRAAGARRVLHLTPTDFHPNPAGHHALAGIMADHLAARYERTGQ